RSPDLIVLFTLVTQGGITLAAYSVGLPPAVGAFASGLVFSGNRWTHQVDALIFPFRETFAAIFFVSLGLIANPVLFWEEPVLTLGALVAVVILKAMAATIALRLTGLRWRLACGMGLGLAHIGEFAFVLVLIGWETGAITGLEYQRVVTISLASLIVTPLLVRTGLKWTQASPGIEEDATFGTQLSGIGEQAIVVGAGPTGRQVASQLETAGHDVCVVDYSHVNLHSFSQQGFRTISGDAGQHDILEHAHVSDASMIIVCVSDDSSALRIARTVRELNTRSLLLVRCRYHANIAPLKRLGADNVVSEQAEASQALANLLAKHISGEKKEEIS
ncbi:MAG: NAD-binding protein, partial [Pirellulales bacterium]|nr:NAD-binding protein [Pirellulales bacterium]